MHGVLFEIDRRDEAALDRAEAAGVVVVAAAAAGFRNTGSAAGYGAVGSNWYRLAPFEK